MAKDSPVDHGSLQRSRAVENAGGTAALEKDMDAWRNLKHMLYKKYMGEGKDPIPAYP